MNDPAVVASGSAPGSNRPAGTRNPSRPDPDARLIWHDPYLEEVRGGMFPGDTMWNQAHLRRLWNAELDQLVIARDPDGSPVLDSHRRIPTTFAGWLLHLPYERNPLSGNDRDHWRVKSQKVRNVRETALMLTRAIPPQTRIRVRLDWEVVTRHDRDEDNVVPCLKALVDGIRLAGVVPKDTREFVLRDMPQINYAPRDPRTRPAAHMRMFILPLTG